MLRLLLAVALVLSLSSADVQVLNDKNFEKITQASTGSTTGSWFVKFYAPW
jgi:thioredoxin domain-containing protein 5